MKINLFEGIVCTFNTLAGSGKRFFLNEAVGEKYRDQVFFENLPILRRSRNTPLRIARIRLSEAEAEDFAPHPGSPEDSWKWIRRK